MEHKLINGGEQYLPFARSRIKALQATGLKYASQKYVIGETTIRVRITPGFEYIELTGGEKGLVACPRLYATLAGYSFINLPGGSGRSNRGRPPAVAQTPEGKDILLGVAKTKGMRVGTPSTGSYSAVSPFSEANISASAVGRGFNFYVAGALKLTIPHTTISSSGVGTSTSTSSTPYLAEVVQAGDRASWMVVVQDFSDSSNWTPVPPGGGVIEYSKSVFNYTINFFLVSGGKKDLAQRLVGTYTATVESVANRAEGGTPEEPTLTQTTSSTQSGDLPSFGRVVVADTGRKVWYAFTATRGDSSTTKTGPFSGDWAITATSGIGEALYVIVAGQTVAYKSPRKTITVYPYIPLGLFSLCGIHADTKHVVLSYYVAPSTPFVDVFKIDGDSLVLLSTLSPPVGGSASTNALVGAGRVMKDYLWGSRYCLVLSTGEFVALPTPDVPETLAADYILYSKDGTTATFYWLNFTATILGNRRNGVTNPASSTNGCIRQFKISRDPITSVYSIAEIDISTAIDFKVPGQVLPNNVIVGTSIGVGGKASNLKFENKAPK